MKLKKSDFFTHLWRAPGHFFFFFILFELVVRPDARGTLERDLGGNPPTPVPSVYVPHAHLKS